MNRRQFIAGTAAFAGGAAAAVEKETDGGLAEVSWAERVRRELALLPPGAGGDAAFRRRCVGCQLCASACPSKCLRPSAARGGRVELDFRYGYCRPGCVSCSSACPTKAIEPVTAAEKRRIRVGHAVWDRARCVRTVEGDECHACEKHCPEKAIRLVKGFPVVDADLCIGCGACEHYCPARPVTAISVVPYEYHRRIRPIAEADLIAEMRGQLAAGKTLVIARDGVIVHMSDGHMIAPVREALAKDPEILRGAIVLDKVVGRAAAELHINGGAKKVVTPVVSEKAKAALEKAGVDLVADLVVPMILNRDRTGECPMDAAFKE